MSTPGDAPLTVVSGGQTGADRAAFDVALELGLPIAGWVPAGRLAEDGVVDPRYGGLQEAPSAEPACRTRLNVRDSDVTLVVTHGEPRGGTALTLRLAQELLRPVLHLDLDTWTGGEAALTLRTFLDRHTPLRLNVAGPRASEDPEVYDAVCKVLRQALVREPERAVSSRSRGS